jgi:predicted ATPase
VRKAPVSLRIGFASNDLSYSVEFGLPASSSGFFADPEIKREAIWTGAERKTPAMVTDRRAGLVRAWDADGAWGTVTEHLPAFDSMLVDASDALRAPASAVVRDRLRSWRFYDGFRTDAHAPARKTSCAHGRACWARMAATSRQRF